MESRKCLVHITGSRGKQKVHKEYDYEGFIATGVPGIEEECAKLDKQYPNMRWEWVVVKD